MGLVSQLYTAEVLRRMPRHVTCAVCEDVVYERDAYHFIDDDVWACSLECLENLNKRKESCQS